MKRPSKIRLQVKREVIRVLGGTELKRVAGGNDGIVLIESADPRHCPAVTAKIDG